MSPDHNQNHVVTAIRSISVRQRLLLAAAALSLLAGLAIVRLERGTPQASTAAPATNTQANRPDAATGSSITISATGFTPADLAVTKGSIVTWTNRDNTNHALDPASGSAGPHSPQLKPGEAYSYSFDAVGTFRYIDVLHPSLSGTISVKN